MGRCGCVGAFAVTRGREYASHTRAMTAPLAIGWPAAHVSIHRSRRRRSGACSATLNSCCRVLCVANHVQASAKQPRGAARSPSSRPHDDEYDGGYEEEGRKKARQPPPVVDDALPEPPRKGYAVVVVVV